MKPRPRFRPVPIDMTPFVSVALMLIVFFVWLKMIQKEQEMGFVAPEHCKCDPDVSPITASLFLLDSNKIGFLTYDFQNSSAEYSEIGYTSTSLRRMLAKKITRNDSIILVKPTAESTFKNLVNLLDEIQIHGGIQYRLDDTITIGEKKMIAAYQHFKQTHPSQPQTIRLTLYPGLFRYN
jgi:biopolymer transport protein ExbD